MKEIEEVKCSSPLKPRIFESVRECFGAQVFKCSRSGRSSLRECFESSNLRGCSSVRVFGRKLRREKSSPGGV